jgi:hypothetical protein
MMSKRKTLHFVTLKSKEQILPITATLCDFNQAIKA